MIDRPPADLPVTAERVGAWLLDELARRGGLLREEVAALEIVRLFGGDFCDRTESGAFRVSAPVREAFDRHAVYSARRVLWDDAARAWRLGATPPWPYR